MRAAHEADPRDSARRAIQEVTAGILERSGDPKLIARAAAMRVCCTSYAVLAHDTDPARTRIVPINRCWDRLCPFEAAHRAHKWIERIRPKIDAAKEAGHEARYIVLPQLTRPGESLRNARARFERAFRRLTQSRRFKRHVHAWVASREMTWSNGAWNYHVNVIYVGEYWDHTALSDAWRWATGGESYIVHIQHGRPGLEVEAIKYALKIARLPAAQLVEYAKVMRGVRLISTGGAWYGVRPPDDADTGSDDGCWRIVSFEKLIGDARQGDAWALARLSIVADWVAERAGAEVADRLRSACREGARDGPALETG